MTNPTAATPRTYHVAGIDYSLTSPAICTFDGDPEAFNVSACRFYFFAANRMQEGKFLSFRGSLYPDYSCEQERHAKLAEWAVDKVRDCTDGVALEDYAFGAKGRVFHIGENTGMLKHVMWKCNVDFRLIAPTELKKHATGKGNADKKAMESAFINLTGCNLRELLHQAPKGDNPSSDLIDAFYLCQMQLQAVTASTISITPDTVRIAPRKRSVKCKNDARAIRQIKRELRALVGARNFDEWLNTPHPAFDGFSPQDLFDRGKAGTFADLLNKKGTIPK